jgi:hypothetical protein
VTAPRRVIVTADSSGTIEQRAKLGSKRVRAKYRHALVCTRDGRVLAYRDGRFDHVGEFRARMFAKDELNMWDRTYRQAHGPVAHPREALVRLRRIVRSGRARGQG